MSQKFLFALACLVVVAAASNVAPNGYLLETRAANQSHHLNVGSRQLGDVLLLRQVVQKKSQWLQIVKEELSFATPRSETITMVRALDQKINGNGAFASLTNGGPGNRQVSLRFKSQRGHGINFVVEVYGR